MVHCMGGLSNVKCLSSSSFLTLLADLAGSDIDDVNGNGKMYLQHVCYVQISNGSQTTNSAEITCL